MIFVDFDKTIFNRSAFRDYLRTREDLPELRDLHDGLMTETCWRLVDEGRLSFEKGELIPFVYEDAAQFLRSIENAGMVITYGHKEFQRMKIENALAGIPRLQVIYTGLTKKGEYLAPHADMYGPNPTLVDDDVEELEVLTETCPTFQLFEMRRDDDKSDGRWPVLHSLAELPIRG